MNFISFPLLLFTSFLCSSAQSSHNLPPPPLNTFLQGLAFKSTVEHLPHTGALYRAKLPSNLSSMEFSVVRLRSRTLWNRGANFSYFSIPSGTLTVPHVRRLAIVYQNLGNLSSYYYTVPGYSLITPVVSFMVFDASNTSSKSITKLRLDTMGKPISIHFPNLTISEGKLGTPKRRCVAFDDLNGSFQMSETSKQGACLSSNMQGHFSVAVPFERRKKHIAWYLWVIGFVLGVSGMLAMGYAGIVSKRVLTTKKIQVMGRQADDDLVLESRWVGSSKIPYAAVSRTLPVLENSSLGASSG